MSHQKFIRLNFQNFHCKWCWYWFFMYKPFAIFFHRHLILSVTCTLPSIITVGDARIPLSIFNMISTIVNSCCRRLCSCCAALWWFIFKVKLVQKLDILHRRGRQWQGGAAYEMWWVNCFRIVKLFTLLSVDSFCYLWHFAVWVAIKTSLLLFFFIKKKNYWQLFAG